MYMFYCGMTFCFCFEVNVTFNPIDLQVNIKGFNIKYINAQERGGM